MAQKKNSLIIRVTGPDGRTQESVSSLESIVLGSGVGAGIKINDPQVSNLHVMLKVEQGMVTAIDLGSEHGTLLGDRPIRDPVALAHGDVLRVGTSEIRVLFGGDPAITSEIPVTPELARRIDVKQAKQNGHAKPGANKVNGKGRQDRALAGTGRNAAVLFNEPLPPEHAPTEDSRVLQVALVWGDTLINVQHFADGVPVRIGEGKGNAFNVFAPAVGPSFTLASSSKSGLLVHVPQDAGVVVSSNGTHKSREQLKGEGKLMASDGGARAEAIQLGLHDRVQVSFETVAFILRYVKPSPRATADALGEADYTFFKITSMCIMLLVAFVAAILLNKEGGLENADDIFQANVEYVKLMIEPEKKVEIKKFKDLSGIEEGAKAKGEEGKFGKLEAKKQDADPSKKGSPIVDANKREEDRKRVMAAGLLGAMGSNSGAASNVFGPGGLGTGINNALGGLKGGAGMGDAHGVGGLGSRGTGPGGGGTGLGLGGLGTKGTGRGAGGFGTIDLGGRGKDTTRVVPGKVTMVGGLSRDVIDKVVKRHQNEIRFCYEQQLQRNPDLAGKVMVSWTIDPSGAVSEAAVAETSLNNNDAEQCMLGRIRRWKFPEPPGGGVVTVNYPWILKAAGDEE